MEGMLRSENSEHPALRGIDIPPQHDEHEVATRKRHMT